MNSQAHTLLTDEQPFGSFFALHKTLLSPVNTRCERRETAYMNSQPYEVLIANWVINKFMNKLTNN